MSHRAGVRGERRGLPAEHGRFAQARDRELRMRSAQNEATGASRSATLRKPMRSFTNRLIGAQHSGPSAMVAEQSTECCRDHSADEQ